MKIPINLASQPFRRDRAMFAASVAVGILLVASLTALVTLANTDSAQLADVRKEVSQLRSQIVKFGHKWLAKFDILARVKSEEGRLQLIDNALMNHRGNNAIYHRDYICGQDAQQEAC